MRKLHYLIMKLASLTIFSLKRLLTARTAAAFCYPFRVDSVITCQRIRLNSIRPIPSSSHTALTNMSSSRLFTRSRDTEDDKGVSSKDSAVSTEACTQSSAKFVKPTNQHKPSPLAGVPIGPVLVSHYDTSDRDSIGSDNLVYQPIIIRYIYEGGHPAQGRLCHLSPTSKVITVPQLINTLIEDGVDMETFYACAYETLSSSGGWMPLERGKRWHNPFDVEGEWKDLDSDAGLIFPLESLGVNADGTVDTAARRIDVKLFRRPSLPKHNDVSMIDGADENPFSAVISEQQKSQDQIELSLDALQAIQSAVPAGKIPIQGYFGIGIIQPKTSSNIGTLLRSAYQLGASIVYTIGGRYKSHSTDTLNVPARIPLIEANDWNAFVENSPRSAVWVVVEMGGTPLSDFKHPRNAIYILGSEDHGVPKNVLRACREVVSLEAEAYASYNVAVAGSIVMYDRMIKLKRNNEKKDNDTSDDQC